MRGKRRRRMTMIIRKYREILKKITVIFLITLTRMIFTRNIEFINNTMTIGDWYIQSSTLEAISGQYISYVILLYKSN